MGRLLKMIDETQPLAPIVWVDPGDFNPTTRIDIREGFDPARGFNGLHYLQGVATFDNGETKPFRIYLNPQASNLGEERARCCRHIREFFLLENAARRPRPTPEEIERHLAEVNEPRSLEQPEPVTIPIPPGTKEGDLLLVHVHNGKMYTVKV
jgi:hypothetical protein